jgi:hypothetical protein
MQTKPKAKAKPVKKATTTKKSVNPANDYKGQKDAWGNPVGGEGRRPPFPTKKTK